MFYKVVKIFQNVSEKIDNSCIMSIIMTYKVCYPGAPGRLAPILAII